ncbi:hypothetical protein OIDMADRAFT_18555 [Oidiodendron maius Zn]|uniref:Uncharacterized protein n=1 Tax=Oidiodendron maius (strain Zn) TaxID=913774 RepID=A0A0C3HLP8_OIDMZ|nr:hypothetical protein OIDMADRAFT_18555 [Oidiodendron maius Zn]
MTTTIMLENNNLAFEWSNQAASPLSRAATLGLKSHNGSKRPGSFWVSHICASEPATYVISCHCMKGLVLCRLFTTPPRISFILFGQRGVNITKITLLGRYCVYATWR